VAQDEQRLHTFLADAVADRPDGMQWEHDMMDAVTIRPPESTDAADVVAMVEALNVHVGAPSCAFSEEHFLRDGLGPYRAFDALVAELDDRLVGYAFFHPSYDTESAVRGSYLLDLYVDDGVRKRGIGRALLAAVARATREAGGSVVWWLMHERNEVASGFYRGLSTEVPGLAVWVLHGGEFEHLADRP
jgi:ribosomal protein S18 acetylase RimI-like enzyme